MKILCTFPGRYGDLLWALPTIRAISEHFGVPVDLQIAGEFASLIPLLERQEYLNAFHADPDWHMDLGWHPPRVWEEATYDRVFHLGYRRWPELPLPFEVLRIAQGEYDLPIAIGDLTRPWITVSLPPAGTSWHTDGSAAWPGMDIVSLWSDCHFELKYGLTSLAIKHANQGHAAHRSLRQLSAPGSRWNTEGGCRSYSWLATAYALRQAKVFLGDCSAGHVLAVAMGKPCIVVEPMEARWNPIFFPLGKDGLVRLVLGNDGLPTVDARHVGDALKEALAYA